MRDPLTDLPDRRLFLEHLQRYTAPRAQDAQRLGLLVVNLHGLRDVNTAFGYAVGDRLLEHCVRRMRAALRPVDVIARIGHNEFGLLLPAIRNAGHATLAATKIIETLRLPCEIQGRTFHVKIAVGVALFPEHGDDAELLLRCADTALSQAKASHAPLTVYSGEAADLTSSPLILESELEKAIEDGELGLHYQPKIELGSLRMRGSEALVHWNSPARGVVPAGDFIPLAEHSGLIMGLTLWTLNTALRQCARWNAGGNALSVAINLSAHLLQEPELPALVEQAMKIWGVRPGQLLLEITESAMMMDPDKSLDTLRRLRAAGVVISIDDFGTGYSSLAYLSQLPVGELKIDQSFVMRMANQEGDARIVRSVIELAHNFDLAIVAEGIENKTTLDYLTAMGCDYGQGFYLGHPLPAEQITSWEFRDPPGHDAGHGTE